MALSGHMLARVYGLLLSLLGFYSFLAAGRIETVDLEAPELTCSEALIDCRMSSGSPYSAALPDPDDTVIVTRVHLTEVLCCPDKQDCDACLRILIELREVDEAQELPAESGNHQEDAGSVKVCLSSPGSSELCKTVQFNLPYSSLEQAHRHHTYEVQLTERVMFGVPVVVQVDSQSHGPANIANIIVPSLEEVCSMDLEGTVKECDAPKLRVVTDPKRDVVLLQLENAAAGKEVMCQMVMDEIPGEFFIWPKGNREVVLPSNTVAPCLCFQIWWTGNGVRREFCPFKNQPGLVERMLHNISVSMAETQMRDGKTGLTCNVTAPCRLEAEVWLCEKGQPGGQCEEVWGSRQRLHNHADASWRTTPYGHLWAGEFNVSSKPRLCVQMKIAGMESALEPQCPFAGFRWRWSLLLFTGLLLISLSFLGVYLLQGALKGNMWRWLKENDLKGAVGGSQVVLLYPPDADPALPGLMNHLGSSLHSLGFTVSLDLWSQGELGALGPVPWLHSRLNQLKRHGGKVVLVLTQATWLRAEEWGAQNWDRNTFRRGNRDVKDAVCPTSSDVFTASLSCVLADYLQGRAGERFMLVQFESFPPKPPGGFRPLPELFHGLHVYSLPSQSLGFLTELAGAWSAGNASARRRRAGVLRMASRFLARRLSGFTTGSTVLHIGGMSQSCAAVGSCETVPLQPPTGQISPPSSPETNLQVTDVGCV
eukprot:XP_011600892.1 PREDICTED: interleukin-17 receptor C-like [Takifugu rubripes]